KHPLCRAEEGVKVRGSVAKADHALVRNLDPFLGTAERVLAVMPAAEGVLHWPREGPNLTTLAYEDHLPLPDNSVDKLLLIHTLEATRDPAGLLREVWRVLMPMGNVFVVVPHRSGAWARADHTPFGIGRPFSSGQLCKLLGDALLEPGEVRRFLCVPPSGRRAILRSTRGWEKFGRSLMPGFSGLLGLEAQKTVMRGIPAAHKSLSLKIAMPGLSPAPKPVTSYVSGGAETPPARQKGSRTTTAR
ncbi:MAG: methyltransferase domain-containing protein, partial [Pseudomonadota bacterium]